MHVSQQQGLQDHHLCILLCALCWTSFLSSKKSKMLRQGQQLIKELAA